MSLDSQRIADAFAAAVAAQRTFEAPYRHYALEAALPADALEDLSGLPLTPPALNGVSGKRELHNDQRHYFDAANAARFPLARAVAEAFQSRSTARLIHDAFAAPIDDTFVRLEYAEDVDGFWLQPHTDLGVKKFTCLIYLDGDASLGTDIYAAPDRHFGATPFGRGLATIFVPRDDTWHGFEKRRIDGVRRSLILNYVTHEWRAREQLSFPDAPVRLGL